MSKKVKQYEIEFEDQGQDFLKWIVEYAGPNAEDHIMGKVVESDMQNDIWTKYYVLSGKPEVGQLLRISENPDAPVWSPKYPVISVKEI